MLSSRYPDSYTRTLVRQPWVLIGVGGLAAAADCIVHYSFGKFFGLWSLYKRHHYP